MNIYSTSGYFTRAFNDIARIEKTAHQQTSLGKKLGDLLASRLSLIIYLAPLEIIGVGVQIAEIFVKYARIITSMFRQILKARKAGAKPRVYVYHICVATASCAGVTAIQIFRSAMCALNVFLLPALIPLALVDPLFVRDYHKFLTLIPRKVPQPPQETQNQPRSTPLRPNQGFRSIVGMDDVVGQLRENVIERWNVPFDPRYNIIPSNGVLFYGPPGAGKTSLARALAAELRYHYMETSNATMVSEYANGTLSKIRTVFEEARQKGPTVLFIDEFESIGGRRETNEASGVSRDRSSTTAGFLTLLENAKANRILVICATNNRQSLDPAIIRAGRFDTQIHVTYPNLEGYISILRHYVTEACPNAQVPDQEYRRIAQYVKERGHSPAELKAIAQAATVMVAREHARLPEQERANLLPITHLHLLEALNQLPPPPNGRFININDIHPVLGEANVI